MKFNIYKRGQGKNTRLWSGLAAAVIVVLGCMRLYEKLQATDLGLWVQIMMPAVLVAVLWFVTFRLLNKHSIADFMIAAEGELKKVSWSSRQEIAVSTFIVIVVVITMALLLAVTDFSFQLFFMWLLG
ncbi:MAG: preprotein translocase subunit SecE [Planctomycetota bacterium]|jgi:preprotein translocase SecE subunit